MSWHYVNEGEPTGPVSDGELLALWRSGRLLPSTLVWREGMTEWQPASLMVPKVVVPAYPPPPPDLAVNSSLPRAPGDGQPPVLPVFFCTVCGQIIPADQLVRIGQRTICAPCKPRFVQHAQEGLDAPMKIPVVPVSFPGASPLPDSDLADPISRFVAYILDNLIVGSAFVAVWFLFVFSGLALEKGGVASDTALGLISMSLMLLTAAGFVFYWVFFIGRSGATPGMKLLKVRMVRADRQPVGYSLAFGRLILYHVINSFTMGLTNLTALFDREKRTVTDMLCGTRVARS